ncbi:UNVERIFIED_CONTAM: hypothetical protein Sradi_2991700 [Sesamum radiatum]|uniref:Reverse transcriptase n=1 Tax=Sesamum radiatum TaxID=300843 RepID=A0AAW2S0N5_SESRA
MQVGSPGGKFLGFMVSQRGIEANPQKIEAIIKMQPPSTAKEVQKLAGRIAALNRFISRSSDKGPHSFKVLKKVDSFSWTKQFPDSVRRLEKVPRFTTTFDKANTRRNIVLILSNIRGGGMCGSGKRRGS